MTFRVGRRRILRRPPAAEAKPSTAKVGEHAPVGRGIPIAHPALELGGGAAAGELTLPEPVPLTACPDIAGVGPGLSTPEPPPARTLPPGNSPEHPRVPPIANAP
ncbi:MAG: hypothetical protein ABSF69_19275 [Polyangiaceae bacterium]